MGSLARSSDGDARSRACASDSTASRVSCRKRAKMSSLCILPKTKPTEATPAPPPPANVPRPQPSQPPRPPRPRQPRQDQAPTWRLRRRGWPPLRSLQLYGGDPGNARRSAVHNDSWSRRLPSSHVRPSASPSSAFYPFGHRAIPGFRLSWVSVQNSSVLVLLRGAAVTKSIQTAESAMSRPVSLQPGVNDDATRHRIRHPRAGFAKWPIRSNRGLRFEWSPPRPCSPSGLETASYRAGV